MKTPAKAMPLLFLLCTITLGARAQSNPLPLGSVVPGTVLGSCSNSAF